MSIVNISLSRSKVFVEFDIMALRFSLMVFDITFSAGDMYMGIIAEKGFLGKSISLKHKVEMIIGYLRNHPEITHLTVEHMEHEAMLHKYISAIKFKTPVMLPKI